MYHLELAFACAHALHIPPKTFQCFFFWCITEIHPCMCVCIDCMYACVDVGYICMCAYLFFNVCMHVVYIRVHIRTSIYKYMHIRTRTHL
jgi:hypothetical protein